MLRALKELHGFQIWATNGIIGHVDGAYFDDERWSVRYLVVHTGSWLHAREVLISPTALLAIDAHTQTIATRLTKKQVEDSPSIDLERPVSRQQESEVNDHYGWHTYDLWDSHIPEAMAAMQANADQPAVPGREGDPHLRSSREVLGYHLHAIDDTLGHVEDFIVDDEAWTIRYLAVDTSNWWFGGHVLISPRWILAVRWPERVVDLAVTRAVIEHSPTWTPTSTITREYEAKLLDYYQQRQARSVDRRSDEPQSSSDPAHS